MDARQDQPALVPHGTALPPPRPGVRHVPLPLVGIVISTDRLRRRIDRRFHWPMILLALAVLPLLVTELLYQPDGWLRAAVEIGFLIVWLAFVVEFIIKITIAESRIEYIRRNWLDLIIIVVPVLRPLRLGSGVARTTRVFKLRGVGMKCARYVFTIIIGMDATERLMHRIGLKPRHERTDPDKMTRHQLEREVRQRRRLADAWERWYETHQAFAEKHGLATCDAPPPAEPEVAADAAGPPRRDGELPSLGAGSAAPMS